MNPINLLTLPWLSGFFQPTPCLVEIRSSLRNIPQSAKNTVVSLKSAFLADKFVYLRQGACYAR